ncbi:flagellar biosynthetic protein FliR [Acetobacterium sp.]|uniref:flagellar biosynthetic protein FliR n=1 Tax=Acetobacterium sp. TaxID=1872094 RepID=UPI002F40D6AA
MSFDMNQYMIFLFASCRVAGMIFFNPIFGRKSIPNVLKVGLTLVIALNAVYEIGNISVINYTTIELMLAMLKEFAVGLTIGFIMQLFLSVFHIGGELIDLQMGFSMASMYDPTSKANISLTGNIMTSMYILLFFISNSHLALMNIVIKSFQVVPIGLQPISTRLSVFFIELFACILAYAVQLSMAIVVTEIIVEVAVGILMRLVPNINVFVVNLQIKILVGLVVLLTIIPALAKYMTMINSIMLERIAQVLTFLT